MHSGFAFFLCHHLHFHSVQMPVFFHVSLLFCHTLILIFFKKLIFVLIKLGVYLHRYCCCLHFSPSVYYTVILHILTSVTLCFKRKGLKKKVSGLCISSSQKRFDFSIKRIIILLLFIVGTHKPEVIVNAKYKMWRTEKRILGKPLK